jgi:hypothetical protein
VLNREGPRRNKAFRGVTGKGICNAKLGTQNVWPAIERPAKFAACIMTCRVPPLRRCSEKDVCDLNNLTTDLRLRLLSSTKLVISIHGTLFEARPDGRARKRSCEGIPVPVEGRE